jgi:hypothetical protein
MADIVISRSSSSSSSISKNTPIKKMETVTDNGQEKFEDAKGVIRSSKLKVDRQFNGQKEKDS